MIAEKTESIDNATEHRDKDEFRRTENFPVEFTHKGDAYTALITNLSTVGAHLQIEGHPAVKHDLLVGEELRLNVFTPYGPSVCTVSVMWFDPATTPVSVGVEFTSLSKDPTDPLRCCIDSAL